MSWIYWIAAVLAVVAATLFIIMRSGPDLAARFDEQLAAARAEAKAQLQPVITEDSIAGLPAPVQRYVRRTGALGKPRPPCVHVKFNAEMFRKPGQAGMTGPADQVDCFAKPKRLFFMTTRMFGLPVAVLHDYEGASASMIVRLASLFTVADLKGEAASRTETVTILNDLCLFAPSWLTDDRLQWQAVDEKHASVTFTNGPHKVSATLYLNDEGDIVNFTSDDRGALQSDGTLRMAHWSTPVLEHGEFSGLRLPARGEAVWNYPEGDFIYGRFTTAGVQ